MVKTNIRFAFTLAEALLTMIILGVVVALTVPTMKQHSDEVKYVATVQKAMSEVTSATANVELVHGDASLFNFGSSNTVDWYAESLKTLSLTQESWTQYDLAGVSSTFTPSFITVDGMAWQVSDGGYACGGGAIFIDVNGPEQPNTIGIDVHGFRVGHLCGGENGDSKTGDFGIFAMGDGVNDNNDNWACTSYVMKHKKMPWLNNPAESCADFAGK